MRHEASILDLLKTSKTLILTGVILLFSVSLLLANPDIIGFESALVWRVDTEGDCVLSEALFSTPGTHYSAETVLTEGRVESITANWEFTGEVTLAVSADGGRNYISVVNGMPISFVHKSNAPYSGNRIKWKADVNADSTLYEVRIVYTDSSGANGDFGNPELTGFKYRKPLYISGADKELFNYQVRLKIGRVESDSEEVPSADLYCDEKVMTDFSDIRFTATDKETLLSYYIDKIRGSDPEQVATVYVRVPQIPVDGLSIYVYYDNPGALSLSDGEAVFDFFDDFKEEALSPDKWVTIVEPEGSSSIIGNRLKLDSSKAMSKAFQIKDAIIEYKAESTSGPETRFIIRSQKEAVDYSQAQVAYSSGYEGAEHCIAIGDIVQQNETSPIAASASYRYQVTAQGENILFERLNAGDEADASISYQDAGGLTQGHIGLGAGVGSISYYDWIRVRKYTEEEPTVDTTYASVQEAIQMPVFENIVIAENGNLILEQGYEQGSYISKNVPVSFLTRVVSPKWTPKARGISVGFSVDSKETYVDGCVNSAFYYASLGDFSPGNSLSFRIDMKGSDGPELDSLKLDYGPGKILVITPNGAEDWAPATKKDIIWSASDYEQDYEMRLEYSVDEGSTYMPIAEKVKNTGEYSWTIPEDAISDNVLIRVSDSKASDVYDESDSSFAISAPAEDEQSEDNMNTYSIESALDDESIYLEEIDKAGQRPGTVLYDLAVKLGDNVNPDAEEDAKASYKEGDIILVQPNGHLWGAAEREKFLIVQLYLTPDEAKEITRPQRIDTGKKDNSGQPIMKTIKRRAKRIDVDKLRASEGIGQAKVQKQLKNKLVDKELIEDK